MSQEEVASYNSPSFTFRTLSPALPVSSSFSRLPLSTCLPSLSALFFFSRLKLLIDNAAFLSWSLPFSVHSSLDAPSSLV